LSKASSSFTSRDDDGVALDSSDDDPMTLDQGATTVVSHKPPSGFTLQKRTKAWSPSRPVVDPSDDASDTSEQPLAELPQLSYDGHPPNEEPEILSTFRPAFEQNMFRLSLDEGSALGLSGPAVALVLSPSATVSFVGAYRLRVLRGSISLLGTTIQPSQVLHHVFAPRSSPIPVIEALVARGESSKSLSNVPAQIMGSIDQDDVVIVLQELRTGIEGLERVVRTFEGVFDRESPEGAHDLPLRGIHLVRRLILRGRSFTYIGPQVTQGTRGMRAFQVPSSWEDAFSALSSLSANEATSLPKPYVLLVKGQKNSGKSTFARALANRLCSRYAVKHHPNLHTHPTAWRLDTVEWPSSNVTSASLNLHQAGW
jgi:polynucleotide 5'-hydroxyl-kinase GRC3/NOL9